MGMEKLKYKSSTMLRRHGQRRSKRCHSDYHNVLWKMTPAKETGKSEDNLILPTRSSPRTVS